MNTSKTDIRIALVGSGSSLADLLAGLASRSGALHLQIRAVVDLGPTTPVSSLDHAREIGIPLVTNALEDIFAATDLDGVLLVTDHPEIEESLAAGLPAGVRLFGPETTRMFERMINLVDENKALAQDSHRLKETRLRLNQFIASAPFGIYVKDNSLAYRRLNSHAQNLLGFREADVIGKRDHSLFPGGSARWLQTVEQKTLKQKETLHAAGVLPVNGVDMYVHVTLFPLVEGGMIEGLYGLIEDTTELFESEKKLHQVDERLNETQKYLREVLENSRDIIFLTDPQGMILSFNSGAENTLGHAREDVVGTQAHDLCAFAEGFDELFSQTLHDGHATKYEAEFLRQDGQTIICDMSLTLIDGPDGKPLEVVGLCRDITTRLRLKEDLIRAERLAAVGQMASGVAHEINNPLAVMDTIAGLVEETLQESGDCLEKSTQEILTRAMGRLHAQVKRVTKITHSLLGFVRKSQAGMVDLDLHELLEECLYVTGTEIRRSRTRVELHFDDEMPRFRSDPMLLEQIFVNLIKNALDAMEDVPRRDAVLEITTSCDQQFAIVHVQDNGVGIPKEEQERIFNLFHTTKPAGKGTGLGLSIVHDLLHRLGGSVRVASEPGNWTRFIIEVPLTPPASLKPDPTISGI